MKQQLLQLSILLKALDPELCEFLGQWDHTDLLLAVKLTAWQPAGPLASPLTGLTAQ